MSKSISRAAFLKGLAGLSVAGVAAKLGADYLNPAPKFTCRMLGPSRAIGHLLRDGKLPSAPQDPDKLTRHVVIVGAGIAGLSVAWWFKKHQMSDFVLLELEPQVGGNAASGKNEVSAYPWGAHYVPLANPESQYVRMIFEETGIITGGDEHGSATYNELYLCHDPQERLFKDGQFQEGLVPRRGLQPEDRQQIAKFFRLIKDLRAAVGKDGKPAFAIPLDLSSADEQFRKLDAITMAEWMAEKKLTSKPLLWYVNYCCRDDYGATIEHVSAWAGIHYFAGRRGTAGNAEMNSVVTWPEGNGFLVNALRNHSVDQIETHMLVSKVEQMDEKVMTYALSTQENKALQIQSDYVIFAAPRFLAKYVIAGSADDQNAGDYKALHYAPWLVANITLQSPPESRGAGLAWDNVGYISDSLGYVVANHQDITTREGAIVVTYYYPLSGKDSVSARKDLLQTSKETWSKLITADLETMHPGITSKIVSIDLWPWGHGMISPAPGYIWGETRSKMKKNLGRIYFAHSDMSGISNFEEAQYHGVQAAAQVLALLNLPEPKPVKGNILN